jgi:two-component sensor histidine kinase
MSILNIKSSFTLIFCFLLFEGSSQDLNLDAVFKSLDNNEKIAFYEGLSDSIKIKNSVFLIKRFNENTKEIKNTTTLFRAKLAIGELNYLAGDYIQSVNVLNRILDDKKNELTATDSMSIYDNLKKSYYKLYLYPEIFEVNSKIQKLINNGAEYPLWSYNMNSKLYGRLYQFDKAVIALKKEINELKKSKTRDSLIIPSAYNDLGYYYYSSKKYDSALVNFNKSLEYADKSLKGISSEQYEHLAAVVKGNIAGIYVNEKKYKEAIPLLLEDVRVGIKSKLNIGSTVHSYNLLATCYLELGDLEKANEIFNNIKPFIDELSDNPSLVGYFKNKANYYHKIKNSDSLSYYFNEAFRVKDFIETKGKNQILASNELIYSITEDHRLIEKHETDLKNQELRIKNKQKNILIIFALVLLLLLVLSLLNTYKLKKSKKEVRQKNKEITLKNEQVKIALSEKNVLLKEVHHRVKNNLQVISGLLELQNISVTDESVKLALKEGQNRIQSVALVHKMMYQSENVSKVNMQQYLEELLQVLELSYSNSQKNIKTVISAIGVDFDVTQAVPISLIVNEAVCNAYKHAFENKKTGTIVVTIIKENETNYSLIIKDDGVGLPEGFDIKQLKSIGFDLIYGLARQLKGKLVVTSTEGTEIKITFSSTI